LHCRQVLRLEKDERKGKKLEEEEGKESKLGLMNQKSSENYSQCNRKKKTHTKKTTKKVELTSRL